MFSAFHSGTPSAVTDVVMWNLYVFICFMYVYSKNYINPNSAYNHYHFFVLSLFDHIVHPSTVKVSTCHCSPKLCPSYLLSVKLCCRHVLTTVELEIEYKITFLLHSFTMYISLSSLTSSLFVWAPNLYLFLSSWTSLTGDTCTLHVYLTLNLKIGTLYFFT